MYNTESKISLTLNPYTYSVLESDARVFSKKENSLGNLINIIVTNYKDDSAASISRRIAEERNRFKEVLLAGCKSSHTRFSADEIDTITEAYINGFEEKLKSGKRSTFVKGITKVIYLNTEVIAFLFPEENYDNWPESKYYSRQNAYLKALLEDYANQPFYIRERICCKDILDKLTVFLDIPEERRGLLRVNMKLTSGKTKLLYVRPYKLMTDPESRFTYLVGYMANTEDGEYRIASLRLSRILDTRRISKDGYGLGRNEISNIEDAIKTRGIAYLIGETETIKVKLTENGVKMYNSILHLRPAYIKKETQVDGFTYLDFLCSQLQIRNYFFQFGAEAVVISPRNLSESIKTEYSLAAAAYPPTSIAD